MSVALTAVVAVVTACMAALVLAGLVRACLDVRRRVPVPPSLWVSLLQIAIFCAGGVFMLMTEGRGSRFLGLFGMAFAALGLVRLWLVQREGREAANRKELDQSHT